MKKIEAIIKGRKFTEKLLGIKKRSIERNLAAAIDDIDRQKEEASLKYEECLLKLADDKVNYKEVLNELIKQKQIMINSVETIKVINEVKEDLNADVPEEE